MTYTHIDAQGVRWRFAGLRPVSEIADRCMEAVGLEWTPDGELVDHRKRRAGLRWSPAPVLNQLPYRIEEHPPRITCLKCGRTSFHPEDVKNRFCPACCIFHDDTLPR